jgi:hypothetical protein
MKKRIVTILMLALMSAGTLGVAGCVVAPPRGHHNSHDRGHDHGHDRGHDHHDHGHWH